MRVTMTMVDAAAAVAEEAWEAVVDAALVVAEQARTVLPPVGPADYAAWRSALTEYARAHAQHVYAEAVAQSAIVDWRAGLS